MTAEIEVRCDIRRTHDGESGISRNSGLTINDFDRNEFRNLSTLRDFRQPGDFLPRVEVVERQTAAEPAAETPESRLRRRAASDYSAPEMRERGERLLRDMNTFAERARASGLSEREISETYRQVGRILEAAPDSRLSPEQRLVVASQVMHNAAHPTLIRQNENTCGVTSLEVRTYSRQPSAAAALVADVALRGSFTGHDGTTVRLDDRSLTPSLRGTTDLAQESRTRNFASQIFQVTAANIANINDPDFRSMRYEQRPVGARDGTGEALVELKTGRVQGHEPGAAGRPNGLIAANESITGQRNDGSSFLVNLERQGRTASRAGTFESAEQLGQRLETLASEGRLPVVVYVHASSRMFNQNDGRVPTNLFNDGHYVTITCYDPVSRTVRYDDQYGPEADRNERPVGLQEFYRATHVVRAGEVIDRLVSARASMTPTDFANSLVRLARDYTNRWQQVQTAGGSANSEDVRADRDASRQRMAALARELPAAQRRNVEAALGITANGRTARRT